MDDAEWVQHMIRQDDLLNEEKAKYQIILSLINRLCDEYKIDKKTCLDFAEINMTVDELAAIKDVEPEFWSDEVKTYHDNIKFILETTINPNQR